MKLEMGPNPDQQTEILGTNASYNVMRDVKESLESNDPVSVEAKVEQIRSVKKFVERELPPLAPEVVGSPDGFYSPAHMIANAVKLVERIVDERRRSEAFKAVTAADQAMRLMAYGMYDKETGVHDGLSGRVSQLKFNLPNLIEIPDNWKRAQDGQDFSVKLKKFIERRKQDVPVEQIDEDLLNEMKSLIAKCHEGETVSKEKAERAPYAREMILMNLELLNDEAQNHKGGQMPGSAENVETFQLIRGLYKYNEKSELDHRIRPGVQVVGLPKIVEQPKELMT